jgi:iron complex outermembrane receptor protein
VWNVGLVYAGVKNVRIRFGINNLFDRSPPFDDESSGSTAGYNPQFGDPVGRLYTITVSYKFL